MNCAVKLLDEATARWAERIAVEDENGQVRLLRQKDRYLYEHQIDEGDLVILEQGLLKKTESS